MKISRIVSVCLVLFALSLSISLVYALWSNFHGVIIYGVIALIVSFVFLYYISSKCQSEKDESCFNLLFGVIVVFVLIIVMACVSAAVYMFILMYQSDESCESISYRILNPLQIFCMPLLFLVMESAVVMALKDTKICLKAE